MTSGIPKNGSQNIGWFKRGHEVPQEWREIVRRANLGNEHAPKYHSEETKRKISLAKKGRAPWNKGLKGAYRTSMKTRKRISAAVKTPTRLERQMISIINKHNLPFKYVGNHKLRIGKKEPDFICTDGRKLVIELERARIHPEDYIAKRKKHYRKHGFECIVVRGLGGNRRDELDEKEVLEKTKGGDWYFGNI